MLRRGDRCPPSLLMGWVGSHGFGWVCLASLSADSGPLLCSSHDSICTSSQMIYTQTHMYILIYGRSPSRAKNKAESGMTAGCCNCCCWLLAAPVNWNGNATANANENENWASIGINNGNATASTWSSPSSPASSVCNNRQSVKLILCSQLYIRTLGRSPGFALSGEGGGGVKVQCTQ